VIELSLRAEDTEENFSHLAGEAISRSVLMTAEGEIRASFGKKRIYILV